MPDNLHRNVIEFKAYGINIGIFCNEKGLSRKIKKVVRAAIPNKIAFEANIKHEHRFEVTSAKSPDIYKFKKNVEDEIVFAEEEIVLEYLASQVRITVAEFAVSNVFIHSGAVSWKGSGIIIPGTSFSGKTTLVSELIKIGAEYYSDEYAVLDEEGFLNPYPKMLSMRGILNDWDQVDTEPEKFGAVVGKKSVPIKMILITKYEKEAIWKPEILTQGEGVLEILNHTIPIRTNPEFVLKVLKKMVKHAIIAKSNRGAAQEFAPFFLDYLVKTLN